MRAPVGPEPAADITGLELDAEIREELRALPPRRVTLVARHLVSAGRLLDEDSEAAYAPALAARRLAPRVAAAREAAGLAAYATGRYAEALAELRAARRLSGSPTQLPVIADCERGLGRPDRALTVAADPEVRRLDRAGRLEMRIVAAGARRDLGQPEAAVVVLSVPELRGAGQDPAEVRLRYAYADALLAAGRRDEATDWFARVVVADPAGLTDAADRLAELQGVVFVDADEEADPGADPPGPG